MGDLQRQQVARMVDQHVAIERDRALEVALEPGPRGAEMAPLALVGGIPQRLAGLDALAQGRHRRLVGRRQHQRGAQAMAEHEGRIARQGRIDRRQRVVEIAMQQPGSPLVALERFAVGGRDGNAAAILQAHPLSP